MKPNLYPAPFIGFEGIDGSGQTTQAHLLEETLQKLSLKVLYTKGPTRLSDAGRKVYEVLEGKRQMGHLELQGLYTEDHKERLDREIIPALRQGTWVITDRYMFSTFAYGTANNVELDWMFKKAKPFILPNLTFYLSISSKEAIRRIQKRGQLIHKLFEKEAMLSRIKASYEEILPQFLGVYIIEGERSIKKVHEDIFSIVKHTLKV